MVAQSIIDTVRRYTEVVNSRFPVKRIILFGSYVRGTPRPDSDIDIAVELQVDPPDHLKAAAELFRLGMDVDVRIEPIIVDEKHDPSGFYEDISSYGLVVYSVN